MSDFMQESYEVGSIIDQEKFKKYVVFVFSGSGKKYIVPYEYAKISNIVNAVISDFSEDINEYEEQILPVSSDTVNESSFSRVIDYMREYSFNPMRTIPKPINSFKISELVLNEFYTNFVYGDSFELTKEQVIELRHLILTSNFLDIAPLTQLCIVKLGILTQKNQKLLYDVFMTTNSESNTESSSSASNSANASEDVNMEEDV